MYFHTCPICGNNLDPGERCECEVERVKELRKRTAANYRMNELLEETQWKQEELNLCC